MFERFIDSEEFLPLPLSGRNYLVNIQGNVITKEGKQISPGLDSYGEKIVLLDWMGIKAHYKLSEVIAHTFKPLALSSKFWVYISVLFADGDKTNLHPSNLVWKFPVGLGSNIFHGFAFIPMFSRYMINRDGVIFDNRTNKLLMGHFNKGYYSFVLRPDVGPKTSLKRHRGLALAFSDYPPNVDQMQVNHKNGIAGDDWVENLEWVTCSENRIHAIENGLTLVNKPVLVTNIKTGEIKEYTSLKSVCQHFRLRESHVSVLLANPEEPLVHDNYEIRYKNREHAFLGNANKCPILVRDIRTGKVMEYDSIIGCARYLGLTKDVIQWRIESPTSCLQPDGLQFKRKSDKTPWYVPLNFEQELLDYSWTKKVLIRNAITGDVKEFNSQRDAASYLNVSESTVCQRLSYTNQPIFKNTVDGTYIQIKNKSDISNWRMSSNPEEEWKASTCSKNVLVKSVSTGEIKEYESAQSCATALNILTTTLNWRLKSKGQKIYPDGLLFKYRNESLPFLTIDETLQSLITSAPIN